MIQQLAMSLRLISGHKNMTTNWNIQVCYSRTYCNHHVSSVSIVSTDHTHYYLVQHLQFSSLQVWVSQSMLEVHHAAPSLPYCWGTLLLGPGRTADACWRCSWLGEWQVSGVWWWRWLTDWLTEMSHGHRFQFAVKRWTWRVFVRKSVY